MEGSGTGHQPCLHRGLGSCRKGGGPGEVTEGWAGTGLLHQPGEQLGFFSLVIFPVPNQNIKFLGGHKVINV